MLGAMPTLAWATIKNHDIVGEALREVTQDEIVRLGLLKNNPTFNHDQILRLQYPEYNQAGQLSRRGDYPTGWVQDLLYSVDSSRCLTPIGIIAKIRQALE
jgi:hypothetical protein